MIVDNYVKDIQLKLSSIFYNIHLLDRKKY